LYEKWVDDERQGGGRGFQDKRPDHMSTRSATTKAARIEVVFQQTTFDPTVEERNTTIGT